MMASSGRVVVVGGGVIGLACALRLRQAGVQVVLLERGEVGRAASWAGAGMVDAGSLSRSDPLAQLRRASVAAYPGFCAEVQELSGVDPEWTPCGSLDVIDDSNQTKAAEREVAAWRKLEGGGVAGTGDDADRSLRVERWDQQRLAEFEPHLSPTISTALHRPGTGHVRNPRLLRAMRGACAAVGVEIVEQVGEVRLESAEGETPTLIGSQDRWSADAVVVAAGSWSSRMHPALAERVRVKPIRGQILALAGTPGVLRHIVIRGKSYLVQRRDGLVLVGSSEEDAGFEAVNTDAVLARLHAFAVRTVPALESAPRAGAWAGLRPASIDGRPYLGPCDELRNVYVATGHFRSGLTLAPVTADLITACVLNRPIAVPLAAFLPRQAMTSDNAGRQLAAVPAACGEFMASDTAGDAE